MNSARQLRDGEPFGLDLLDGGVDVFNRTEPASLLLREPQSLSSAGGARPGGGGYYYFQPPVRAGFLMEGEDAYDLDFNLSLDYKSNRMNAQPTSRPLAEHPLPAALPSEPTEGG